MNAPSYAATDAVPETGTQYNVPGLERGLRILSAFSGEDASFDAAELSRRLAIPRTTTFRLLQTLESLGYLEPDHANGRRHYRLGRGVLRLGFEQLSGQDLTDHGLPLIEALRDETGFTTHLLIRDGREVVFVAKAQSYAPAFGSVKLLVGSRLPAHATTHGHLLMGDLTLTELQALYPEPQLQRFTEHTPAGVAELHRQIRTDAARGYAIGESSFEFGISVVSAPVRNHRGRIAAVVAATVPAARIAQNLLEHGLIERVVQTAAALSARLNYRAHRPVTQRVRISTQGYQ
jgi:DNA-binding IclR family transcriptional regulator